eukprot:TRINITY_DN11786_c0_g1_i1.p1 TRINITY_DN11786_c0_g1~~TRINITY_DN11786_c0_g1_i1.p1  ORF type:complete len:2625 (+),score=594.32 TRINITY_DN11786_c0_g1_i1:277-8151(+)
MAPSAAAVTGGRRRHDDEIRPEEYMNCVDQYTSLVGEAFFKVFGTNWQDARTDIKRLDLSGVDFALETLMGPDGGIMHPKLHRSRIEIVNVSKNMLTSIDVFGLKTNGRPEFPNLRLLNASHNMLSEVKLEFGGSLIDINLSGNELVRLPPTHTMPLLQKLLVARNRIDGDLGQLSTNMRLRCLDISHNAFSWKPTAFKRQLTSLRQTHVQELSIWPNPFAKHFREYQLITIVMVGSINIIDGWTLDQELKDDLRQHYDKMRGSSMEVDFGRFDILVEERAGLAVAPQSDDAKATRGVPAFPELLTVMDAALDYPAELIGRMYEFERMTLAIFQAPFSERARLLSERGADGVERPMRKEEAFRYVSEFADRVRELMGRYESVRELLVGCLVKLVASGCAPLAEQCVKLLMDWTEANNELAENIDRVSLVFFLDLRWRCINGVQSLREAPQNVHNATRHGDVDPTFHGSPAQVAECASILKALSKFGRPSGYTKCTNGIAAKLLRGFLPALCRDTRTVLGENQPFNEWSEYVDFDVLADETSSTMIADPTGLESIRKRCLRQGSNGFVTELVFEEGDAKMKVYFKNLRPETIVGCRRPCPGRVLHVRPMQVSQLDANYEGSAPYMSAWTAGLAVLVNATADPSAATIAVQRFKMHEMLAAHFKSSEDWAHDVYEISSAFVLLLELARNLLFASGQVGRKVWEYFVNEKLHLAWWSALTGCLMQDGNILSPPVLCKLEQVKLNTIHQIVMTLSTLITHANEIGINRRARDAVASELVASNMDAYTSLLQVAGDSACVEPLLLVTALEMIYMMLYCHTTMKKVLTDTLSHLKNMATLLPYIRGPTHQGLRNKIYMELWRACELKYGPEGVAPARELYDGNSNAWHARVPLLKDVQNPLMHRALLGVVCLIELCSEKQQYDTSGFLMHVTNMLNSQGREQLLLGPMSGLINCVDYDVKIQCLKCIQHVLRTSPEQFEAEEMGWLLRYLSPLNLGIPRQDEFLSEVASLISVLLLNDANTGDVFREKFAKSAVRECFSIFVTSCARNKSSALDENCSSKSLLKRRMCAIFQACSVSTSGALRPYLRRADLLSAFREIILDEDGSTFDFQHHLFATWTGRDTGEILLPLATGPRLGLFSQSRVVCMMRLADVLQGRRDLAALVSAEAGEIPEEISDERNWWRGLRDRRMAMELCDNLELEDWRAQQEEYISCDGLGDTFQFLDERIFARGEVKDAACYPEARQLVQRLQLEAERSVEEWWRSGASPSSPNAPAQHFPSASSAAALVAAPGEDGAAKAAAGESASAANVEENDESGPAVRRHRAGLLHVFFQRLKTINSHITHEFGENLDIYVPGSGAFLKLLAENVLDYFEANEAIVEQLHEKYPEEMEILCGEETELPSMVISDGKLAPVDTVLAREGKVMKVRQQLSNSERGTMPQFLRDATAAAKELKKILVQRTQVKTGAAEREAFSVAREWSSKTWELWKAGDINTSISRCISDFLASYQPVIIDSGLKSLQDISFEMRFDPHEGATRARGVVFIVLEFRNPRQLIGAAKELQTTNRLRVVSMRNFYIRPSGLGRRAISMFVEIPISAGGSNVHVCQLSLVVNMDARRTSETRRQDFLWGLRRLLREKGQTSHDQEVLTDIAQFLEFQLESRSIQSGDLINFEGIDELFMDVNTRQGVVGSTYTASSSQTFQIIKLDGGGKIKFGDSVRLLSELYGNYVDVDIRGMVRCRYNEEELDQGNCDFVVEFAPELTDDNNAGFFGWMTGQAGAAAGAGASRSPTAPGQEATADDPQTPAPGAAKAAKDAAAPNSHRGGALRSGLGLRLRCKGQKRYLSLKPSQSMFGGDRKVFAIRPDDRLLSGQRFELIRLGGAHAFLHARRRRADAHAGASAQACLLNVMTQFMVANLPASTSIQAEGGAFGLSCPQFRASAQRQAGLGAVPPEDDQAVRTPAELPAWDAAGAPQEMVGSLMCCIYSMLTSSVVWVSDFAMHVMFGAVGTSSQRLRELLTFVVSARISRGADGSLRDALLPHAWLPQKLLRLIHHMLVTAPALCDDCGPRTLELETLENLHRSGAYDKHRVKFLGTVSNYMEQVLAPDVLRRLAVARFSPLTLKELILLREFAKVMEVLARGVLANELRRASSDHRSDDADAIAEFGRTTHHDGCLSEATRAAIASKLLGPASTRVLVQAFLYGVNREFVAYQNLGGGVIGAAERHHVKPVSSLVDRCVGALALVMLCSSEVLDARNKAEYNISEAISQAITAGGQIVPRGRVAELMRSRAAERFRISAQALMRYSLPEQERIISVGYARVCNFKKPEPRCYLVAVTTRGHMLLFKLPVDDLMSAVLHTDMAGLTLVSVRDLQRLQRVIVTPRARQFVGLDWYAGTQGTEDEHEVLIFDSALARRSFREALRNVLPREEQSLTKETRGREVLLHRKTLAALQLSCVPVGHTNPVQLASIIFVRAQNMFSAKSDGLELLALTNASLTGFTFASFMQLLREHAQEVYPLAHQTTEDSDSDGEALSRAPELPVVDDRVGKVRFGPHALKRLKGVWFLSEAEPKVRVQLEEELEFHFFSDAERQRFRQHLALALSSGADPSEETNGNQWAVCGHGDKSSLTQVKKHLRSKA